MRHPLSSYHLYGFIHPTLIKSSGLTYGDFCHKTIATVVPKIPT